MLNVLLPITIALVGHIQADKAIPTKLGKTQTITLEKGKKQDYTVALTKGTYRVVLDTKGLDEADKPSNCVQGSVKLMKQNGATSSALTYDFLGWYEFDALHREVRTLTIAKNTAVRFRVQNSTLSKAVDSLTITPISSGFVPFGYGSPVQEAKVGDENGVGGSFDYLGYAYYRAKLPAGKWSISLGLRRPSGADSYVCGTLALLDETGKRLPNDVSKVDVTEDTGRTETVLTLKKPATIIIRAKNISNNHGTLNYDVTVRKAEN